MKQNYSSINDEDFIEEFNETYKENKLVLSSKKQQQESIKRSTWDNEIYEVSNSEKEPLLNEIPLYDPSKTKEENFENTISSKYLLIEIGRFGTLSVNTKIPDQFSKVVVDIDKIEEYGLPEFLVVDYDTIFGVRLTSFINYNSDFFTCDERVFFEALLIKYKSFGFKAFFWSKQVMWKELGLKKDRVNRIIKKFTELDIISTEVKKSFINGRPQQITYFNLHPKRICELLSQIYNERESSGSQIKEVKKYLNLK